MNLTPADLPYIVGFVALWVPLIVRDSREPHSPLAGGCSASAGERKLSWIRALRSASVLRGGMSAVLGTLVQHAG
jgi:hypothetical protein